MYVYVITFPFLDFQLMISGKQLSNTLEIIYTEIKKKTWLDECFTNDSTNVFTGIQDWLPPINWNSLPEAV